MAMSIHQKISENYNIEDMFDKGFDASNFLKAMAHHGRLMILCHLVTGEKSVTELENLLSLRQAAVSQQLARLRFEDLVGSRREGKAIYYSIKDKKVLKILFLLHEEFSSEE